MASSLFQYISGLSAAALVLLALRIRASQKRARLPPGPKPLPLIGNLRDMPSSEEWLTWQSYVERYGDLVFLTALGSNYLILGSQEAINDVIEKRAHVNGRPSLTMLHDLMDIKWLLASMPYGEYWRQSRKIIHTYFHAGAATEFELIQIQGARRFVRDLLVAEQQSRGIDRLSDAAKATLPNQIRLYLARTGVRMTYGIDLCDSATEAKYIDGPEAIMRAFGVGATPGRFLVDYFPILKYIPSWVPGAGFQLYAKKTAVLSKQVRDDPVAVVKAQMAAGTAPVSLAAQLLESVPDSQEQLVKDSVASMLLGAGDTSSGAITAFFLAMVAHPEVQKCAQEELDCVVGRGRLPEYSDKKDLVYIEAVIRETLRWLPVAPSGAPHMTERDDEYRGFFIPKGTLTIPLQWNVLRDHKIYPEPETFSPDRYLTRCADGTWVIREDVLDPRKIAFGFGRRVCPGTHIAEQTLFAAISTTLHTVDIMRAKNVEGKEIMPEIGLISGLVCHPRLFAYELRMRDDARELVNMSTTAVV